MPQFLEYSVKERRDFERLKNRFDPSDPKGYPVGCESDMIDYYNRRSFHWSLFNRWGHRSGFLP